MTTIDFKREISDSFGHAVERIINALGAAGFSILTRRDMHSKIQEKTDKASCPPWASAMPGGPGGRSKPTR